MEARWGGPAGSGGEGSLSETEREELNWVAQGERRPGDGARCAQTLGCPLGQGSDAAVSLAALIAARRAEHGILVAVARRALGVSQAWFHKWRKGDRSPRRKSSQDRDEDAGGVAFRSRTRAG